ncbi:hypothetical protein [Gordonia sp. (in: high G+C Gram-positive bacteria)]|uniref:hypothetical protein n=1 Tax=Gordonia sp. (in: high G+C Gram-positive bacteria) TaxID=84139 RepID=UPI0039E4FBED
MDDPRLDELADLAAEAVEHQSAYLAAKQERDIAIRQLIAEGVSMYQIAQTVDLSQQAVRKIRDSSLNQEES